MPILILALLLFLPRSAHALGFTSETELRYSRHGNITYAHNKWLCSSNESLCFYFGRAEETRRRPPDTFAAISLPEVKNQAHAFVELEDGTFAVALVAERTLVAPPESEEEAQKRWRSLGYAKPKRMLRAIHRDDVTALPQTPKDFALGFAVGALFLALPFSAVFTALVSRMRALVPKSAFAGIALATLVFFTTHAAVVLAAAALAYAVQHYRTA